MVDKVARIVLCLAFLGIGLYLVVMAVRELSMGLASANWAQAEAQVAEHEVYLDTEYVEGEARSETDWVIDVIYAYRVDDAEYSSTIKARYPSQDGADEFMAQYPVGSPLTVYYDPEHPERVVVERGIGWQSLLKLVAGLAFAALGIWWVVGMFRRREEPAAA